MSDAGTVSRQMRLSAFSMNCVGHQSQGLWRHPRDRSTEYTSIELWVELARTLERGCFDAFFLADVLGVYDVYGGSADAALRNAAQVPVNDPMLVVPVMAAVTEHLGFGITAITSFEPPYTFARRMSTLDHLTRGRVSWNIVTGYLDSAARAMGEGAQTDHDERYEEAEEYLEVVYRLWEGSWEDDAVVRDRIAGVYADPAKVHRVAHHGRRYHVDGIHLAEPSPQRTPVLFQAGSSPRGLRFAARHAECVFVAGNDRAATASTVTRLREEIAAAGRDPDGVLVYSMVSIVVDETTAAARRKADEYAQWASPEGALALLSGWSGLDYARPLDGQTSNRRDRRPQPGHARPTSPRPRATSRWPGPAHSSSASPADVADRLEEWLDATGVDGFNITRQVLPETYADVVDHLVPELQRRGVHRRDLRPGHVAREAHRRPRPAARPAPGGPPPPPTRPVTHARGPDRHEAGRWRLAAVGGIVGPAAFIGAWVVGSATKAGYSPIDDAISRLAAVGASTKPLMTAGFLVFGIGVPIYATALRRALGGLASVTAAATGLATIGVAALPLERSRPSTRGTARPPASPTSRLPRHRCWPAARCASAATDAWRP